MKKILVFGTFDIFHTGHLRFLQAARRLGAFLTVVIGRDKTVHQVKGYHPYFTEIERIANLRERRLANRVILGSRDDKYAVIEALKPDVLCLGYDQLAFTEHLSATLAKRGLHPKIVRLPEFQRNKNTTGLLHRSGIVAIKNVDRTIITEPRYATSRNFTGEQLYLNRIVLVRHNIAEKLKRVQRRLRRYRVGLKIWDCYRPLAVQKILWQHLPDERYVGNPKKGPVHTRAAGIDCTLVNLATKRELVMPTKYDEFSDRAHRTYPGHSDAALKNMRRLETAMRAEGLLPLPTEWWHYSDPNWKKYQVLDVPI